MTYRVLCDENVDPQTVQYLERDGHDATHVLTALHASVDDATIADYAAENGYLVLTSDADFLDSNSFPDVNVLYFPDDTHSSHDLASMVAVVASYCPEQSDLPRESFLTERLL
ncbi:DUF5615 family PIN-like protein [Halococcus sp. AFM35]|uniref:DUF5615 family PIN-like protein n=1 Tax=Halococcus sp. AFM35 TaxID=3421653 RepID=UPI003EB9B79D